jgi:hypothetical protein
MANKADFEATFERLKAILQPFEPHLVVVTNTPGNYYLDTPYTEQYQKALMFGAAHIKKNYVSYYLFPIYMCPTLLDGMSAKLKKRMQGKSCFNFTSIDEETLNELSALTQKGFERFQKENLIPA